jgi:hypothetical protein
MSKLPHREIRKSSLSPTTEAILSLIAGLLPAVVAVAGGLWAVHTYLAQESAKVEQSRLNAQEPFLRKQLDLFFTTAEVTGQLINLKPDTPEWDAAEKRFWSLRWSEVEMAGDAGIRQAMRRVQYALVQRKTDSRELAKHKLRWMVECLADELRLSLENTWGYSPSVYTTDGSR